MTPLRLDHAPTPIVLGLATLIAGPLAGQQWPLPVVTPRPGLVLTHSARIRPGAYRLPAPTSMDSALIVIRGSDIVVDFHGVTLDGAPPGADPDGGAGVAIRVDGGSNVRIERARVRGYKVGILARDTRELTLRDNNVSDNWKPRLFSLVEHESLADWLSFHHNEAGEWLRFGAGIYLEGVRGGTIAGNTGEDGMNGLMLARTDSLRILDNGFSFNSGLGIGLYRSSWNSIVHNRLDYNVRGFSHRFYRRGQDSAGLLLFEQSSHNTVAWNSVTHGGDGLFLWAGQETMDSGTGGSNDNLFTQNDFSYAPTNAMEATFSRNAFIANRAEGSDHGLWGGYSYESSVLANCFGGNRIGIAIEHGQKNTIGHNRFRGDSTAIRLWADRLEPSDWGYPKHRDTRSIDYLIGGNRFEGNRVGLRASNTTRLSLVDNRFVAVDTPTVLRDTAGYLARPAMGGNGPEAAAVEPCEAVSDSSARIDATEGQRSIPRSEASRLPRSAIMVDEWGPYDWRGPRLWPVDSTRADPLALATVGPAGRWRVVEQRGVRSLSRLAGRIGDTLVVFPAPGPGADWSVTLEYLGDSATPPPGRQGRTRRPAAPRFSYGRFEPALDWAVRYFTWPDSADPRKRPAEFAAALAGPPLLTRREPRLDLMWYRPAIPGIPQERWALEATGRVELPPGEYSLRSISDDGVRVWIDGALAIDDWEGHESAVAYAPITGGLHDLRVQYYQADGWSELRVEILRGRIRSAGSPGPH